MIPSVGLKVGRFSIVLTTLHSLEGQLLLLLLTCEIVACSMCLGTCHFSPVGRRGGPQELRELAIQCSAPPAVSFPRLGASCRWEEPILQGLSSSGLPYSLEEQL